MCGLNLIWDKNNSLDSPKEILKMNLATSSRGPDDSQVVLLKNTKSQFYLGHNRLKIRDLSPVSRQPCLSKDQQFALLYNGELYSQQGDFAQKDTIKLFKHLHQNLQIYTHPEIQKTCTTLNGMYAWAWLDLQHNTLLIARDNWKIKPLYYFENEQFLLISSEIKGILASGLVSKKLNESQISHYLTFRFAASPQTFFEGIYQVDTPILWDLEKGIRQEIPIEPKKIYQNTQKVSAQDLIIQTEKALTQSLHQQLAAEVPVGLFLSGGVDSTLLLALLREQGKKNFPVFTLGDVAKQGTQDSHFAQKAAQQYGGKYQEISLSSDCLRDIPPFFSTLDQPIADPAAYLTHLLSQEAKKSVKVVLSGAGADELFAGYHRHEAFQKYLKYQSIFHLVPPSFIDLFSSLQKAEKQRQIKKFFSQIGKTPQATFVNFTKLQWSLGLENMPLKSNDLKEKDLLAFALFYDQRHYLAQDVLAITDQSSMQHGLEIRVPYLDAEICAVLKKTNALQIFGKSKKWILKEILNQKGGEIYTSRRKEGFGFPFGKWLREPQNQHLALRLLDNSNSVFKYLSHNFAEINIKAHLAGKLDFSSEIWALWCLQVWLDFHFE